MPLPAGLALQTPEADLTESGDSFNVLETIDTVLHRRLTDSIAIYANGHDLTHPYLSPLFGDFSKGFPPTFLQTGTYNYVDTLHTEHTGVIIVTN